MANAPLFPGAAPDEVPAGPDGGLSPDQLRRMHANNPLQLSDDDITTGLAAAAGAAPKPGFGHFAEPGSASKDAFYRSLPTGFDEATHEERAWLTERGIDPGRDGYASDIITHQGVLCVSAKMRADIASAKKVGLDDREVRDKELSAYRDSGASGMFSGSLGEDDSDLVGILAGPGPHADDPSIDASDVDINDVNAESLELARMVKAVSEARQRVAQARARFRSAKANHAFEQSQPALAPATLSPTDLDAPIQVPMPGGRVFVTTQREINAKEAERASWAEKDRLAREKAGPKPDVWRADFPDPDKLADLLKNPKRHMCATCKHSVQTLEALQSESGNIHHQVRHFCSLITDDGGDSLEFEGPLHYCSRHSLSATTIINRGYVQLRSKAGRWLHAIKKVASEGATSVSKA